LNPEAASGRLSGSVLAAMQCAACAFGTTDPNKQPYIRLPNCTTWNQDLFSKRSKSNSGLLLHVLV
jgi:hypothetical protein